ncbi:hypothetical protein ONZ45_g8102 [Pleurotus djamor]|nr:hypothetical protein ONZ45_g8102 [Pleurotus djamor]
MQNHQYLRKRLTHNRLSARQDTPENDGVAPPVESPSVPPPQNPSPSQPSSTPPPPPASTPSSTPAAPSSSPPVNNQPRPSPSSSTSTPPPAAPRTTTTSTPLTTSTPTSTITSSEVSSSSLESSSSSSSLVSSSSSTVLPTTTTLPALGGGNRQISSFSTLPRTTFSTALASSSASATSTPEATGALNTGALVGGIAGGLVALGIFVLVAMYLLRRLRKRSYEEDQFDPVTFRRSAVLLDDPSTAQPKNGGYDTFDPRPPSMLERKLNAHPVAPSPVPQAAYNYEQYGYQGQAAQGYGNGYNQYYDSASNGHGYAGHPYAQDPHAGHQAYGNEVPTSNPYTSTTAVPAARATTRTGAPRDSRVISKVDDADVYGGI